MSQKELDCQLRDAAHEGNLGRLKELLDASADPRATSSFGRTPLHWACCRGHTACIAPLLSWGADPRAADGAGWTPLHYACWNGNAACIAPLLSAGADMSAVSNNGRTPRDLAEERDDERDAACLAALDTWKRQVGRRTKPARP